MVEIMIVVAIIGLLAAIAIPNFVNARKSSQAKGCINNLRQFDGAAAQWALENHKTDSDSATLANDLTPYIKLNSAGSIPPCPANGTYSTSWGVTNHPTCSLSSLPAPFAHALD